MTCTIVVPWDLSQEGKDHYFQLPFHYLCTQLPFQWSGGVTATCWWWRQGWTTNAQRHLPLFVAVRPCAPTPRLAPAPGDIPLRIFARQTMATAYGIFALRTPGAPVAPPRRLLPEWARCYARQAAGERISSVCNNVCAFWR